jgi:hypothetical protein
MEPEVVSKVTINLPKRMPETNHPKDENHTAEPITELPKVEVKPEPVLTTVVTTDATPTTVSTEDSPKSILPWLLGGLVFLLLGTAAPTPPTQTTSYSFKVGQWPR